MLEIQKSVADTKLRTETRSIVLEEFVNLAYKFTSLKHRLESNFSSIGVLTKKSS